MSTVTEIENELAELAKATDRLDRAETEAEDARKALGELARRAWTRGVSVDEIRRVTGYSRGYVYTLMGPLDQPRGALRRSRRRQPRGS